MAMVQDRPQESDRNDVIEEIRKKIQQQSRHYTIPPLGGSPIWAIPFSPGLML
jgi:hypothetical protein